MKLRDLVSIRAGYSFRGKIPISDNGLKLIQMKDIENAELKNSALDSVDIKMSNNELFLRNNDILFLSRGTNTSAILIENIGKLKLICSSQFFMLRINDKEPILPEFLVILLNSKELQNYFKRSSEGISSTVRNIKRITLEEVDIIIPNIRTQKTLINLHKSAKREKVILESLINYRNIEVETVTSQILNKGTSNND